MKFPDHKIAPHDCHISIGVDRLHHEFHDSALAALTEANIIVKPPEESDIILASSEFDIGNDTGRGKVIVLNKTLKSAPDDRVILAWANNESLIDPGYDIACRFIPFLGHAHISRLLSGKSGSLFLPMVFIWNNRQARTITKFDKKMNLDEIDFGLVLTYGKESVFSFDDRFIGQHNELTPFEDCSIAYVCGVKYF